MLLAYLAPRVRAPAYHASRSAVKVRAAWSEPEFHRAVVRRNDAAATTPDGTALRRVVLDVGIAPARSHGIAGQFVQARAGSGDKAAFAAIASAPGERPMGDGTIELLLKAIDGSTAAMLCDAALGDVVECSGAIGKGFATSSAGGRRRAVLVATGTGISPIRSLLRSGALDGIATTLYYGTSNAAATAFLEESESWPCDVVRVYSEERGAYVQDVLREDIASGKLDVGDAFAVLCGQKDMTTAVIEVLTAAGVPREMCLMNF